MALDVRVVGPGPGAGPPFPVVKVLGCLEVSKHGGSHFVCHKLAVHFRSPNSVELGAAPSSVGFGVWVCMRSFGAIVRPLVLIFVFVCLGPTVLRVGLDPGDFGDAPYSFWFAAIAAQRSASAEVVALNTRS